MIFHRRHLTKAYARGLVDVTRRMSSREQPGIELFDFSAGYSVATPNIGITTPNGEKEPPVWLFRHLWILYFHAAGALVSFAGLIAMINMHGSDFLACKCMGELSANGISKLDLISARIMGHFCLSSS
jgi:hypothetical protein